MLGHGVSSPRPPWASQSRESFLPQLLPMKLSNCSLTFFIYQRLSSVPGHQSTLKVEAKRPVFFWIIVSGKYGMVLFHIAILYERADALFLFFNYGTG